MNKNSKIRVNKSGETIPRTPRQILSPLPLKTYTEVVQHGAHNQDMENQDRPNQGLILEAFRESLKKVGENQEKASEDISKAHSNASEDISKAHGKASEDISKAHS
ncbi:hypothetical protein AKO1_014834, partial [Acrasis kona]